MRRRTALLLLPAALLLMIVDLASDNLKSGFAAAAAEDCGRPGLSGTFYQPLVRHLDWTDDRWRALEDALLRLGMSELFVQWSSADGLAFYPSATLPHATRGTAGAAGAPLSPLDRMFDIARRRDIDVWVGLDLDKHFLPTLQRPPAELAAHLLARERRLAGLLPDLAAYLGREDRLAGWYISAEIHDGAWIEGPAGALVRQHLQRISRMLKQAVDRPVAISAFANGELPPERYAAFWQDILQAADIDLLLFQDGVGAAKLSPGQAGSYAAALARAVQSDGRQFGVIVEQFRHRPGGDGAAGPAFEAATPERVRQQLDAIAAIPGIRRIAFTLPDYILPDTGAGLLLDGLQADRDACR